MLVLAYESALNSYSFLCKATFQPKYFPTFPTVRKQKGFNAWEAAT